MSLVRFEPWSVVDLLHRDMSRLNGRRIGHNSENAVADWVPAVDIVEETQQFVLRADLPGVNPADIDVSMDAGVLTVSGQRAKIDTAEGSDYQRIERRSGKFLRRFSLPDSADPENIAAKSDNGILEVTIPKRPELKARRITVEAA